MRCLCQRDDNQFNIAWEKIKTKKLLFSIEDQGDDYADACDKNTLVGLINLTRGSEI